MRLAATSELGRNLILSLHCTGHRTGLLRKVRAAQVGVPGDGGPSSTRPIVQTQLLVHSPCEICGSVHAPPLRLGLASCPQMVDEVLPGEPASRADPSQRRHLSTCHYHICMPTRALVWHHARAWQLTVFSLTHAT